MQSRLRNAMVPDTFMICRDHDLVPPKNTKSTNGKEEILEGNQSNHLFLFSTLDRQQMRLD